MNMDQDQRVLVKVLVQLNFYLTTIQLPFNAYELYCHTLTEIPQENLSEERFAQLSVDPDILAALDEPFTTHTIAETLLEMGNESLLRELITRVRDADIEFTQAYIMGAHRRHRPRADGSPPTKD